MKTYRVYWAPEGRQIAEVQAKSARQAIRQAPLPYRKYLGELYAVTTISGPTVTGKFTAGMEN